MAFNLFPQIDFRQMDLNYVLEVSKQAAANLEEYAADKEQVVATQAAAEAALAAAQEDIQTATNAAASAEQNAQTATGAAGTATQAAASASADAQTASEAAQTAQEVAESIPADYSQLSQDVDDLKSDLNRLNDEVGMPFYASSSGTAPQSSQASVILEGLSIVAYHEYTITLEYESVSDAVSYIYITDSNINVLSSKTITAGTATATFQYIPNSSYENAKILVNTANRALNYEIEFKDNKESKIDNLEADKLNKYIYSNNADLTFESAGTQYPNNHAYKNHVYEIKIDGESSVGVNVRAGSGSTVVGIIALDCIGGKSYFVKYVGDDANNLIVFASGACSVIIKDLNAIKQDDRIYIRVSTVAELLSAIEISQSVKATIYLSKGTYDLIEGLGNDYFNNAPSQNFGLVLCNDVALVGDEGSVITANYTGSNVNVMKYFSPFNAGKCVYPWNLYGSFTLKNIHLEGSKIRYLIHDENNQHDIPYHNVYEDCYFYFDNSQNTEWSSYAIIGGGLGEHGYIEIKNNIFVTPALANRTAVVSYHNSLAENAKSHLVITGNLISPTNAILRLGYHGTSTEKTIVLATNNKWGGVPGVSAETSDDTVNNFDLIEWNNIVISS